MSRSRACSVRHLYSLAASSPASRPTTEASCSVVVLIQTPGQPCLPPREEPDFIFIHPSHPQHPSPRLPAIAHPQLCAKLELSAACAATCRATRQACSACPWLVWENGPARRPTSTPQFFNVLDAKCRRRSMCWHAPACERILPSGRGADLRAVCQYQFAMRSRHSLVEGPY